MKMNEWNSSPIVWNIVQCLDWSESTTLTKLKKQINYNKLLLKTLAILYVHEEARREEEPTVMCWLLRPVWETGICQKHLV